MIPAIRALSSIGFRPSSLQRVEKGRFYCEKRFFSNKTDSFFKENSSNVGSPEMPLPGTEENKAMLHRISAVKLLSPRTNPFAVAIQNKNPIFKKILELQQENIKIREDNNKILESVSSLDQKLEKLLTLAAKQGIVKH